MISLEDLKVGKYIYFAQHDNKVIKNKILKVVIDSNTRFVEFNRRITIELSDGSPATIDYIFDTKYFFKTYEEAEKDLLIRQLMKI